MAQLPGAPYQLPYPWMTGPWATPPINPSATGAPSPGLKVPAVGGSAPKARAGLLELLSGVSPSTYAGIISDDDRKTAQQRALMSAAASLLNSGGPSRIPVGTGQALGQAYLAAQQGGANAIEQSLHAAYLKRQFEPKAMPPEDLVIIEDPRTGKPRYATKSEAAGLAPYQKPEPQRAPESRTIDRDGSSITQEWDDSRGVWRDIATAPRWQPQGSTQQTPPAGYRYRPDNSLEFIPGGPADPASRPKESPKPTEADRKAVVLIQGMRDAEQQLASFEGQTNPAGKWNAAMGSIPFTGGAMQTDQYRGYQAAAKRWAANYLYLKSGAQAGAGEIETTTAQFFPQPGDGPEIIEQKRIARQQEMASAQSVYGAQQGGATGSWAPSVGTVQRGYRFQGGDPANKANWEKL